MSKSVCLIGAGPSGLSCLYAFSRIKNIPKVVCLEQQQEASGLWNYTWQTGTNEHGLPVHGSMYRALWSNGPKECLEYPNYTFTDHFNKPIGSFPPREVLRDYIMGRAQKNNLLDDIKYLHKVENVRPLENGQFEVGYRNLKDDTTSSEEFSHVIVASGHFSVPNIPTDIPDIDKFNGSTIHAHSFRNAQNFTGKNIVIIGGSYSAEDIGLQCYKYGAANVTISVRNKKMGFKWPARMQEYGGIVSIDDKEVRFTDGVAKDVDTIICCTGYQHHFPFMDNSIKLRCRNTLYQKDLYKGVCYVNNPNVYYIGMQDQYYTFTMFDIQAHYIRDMILQTIKTPDKETMNKDIDYWWNRMESLKDCEEEIYYQNDYLKDLCSSTNYCSDFSQVDATKEFIEWEHDKDDNILTYRDKQFKSIVDGTLSSRFKTTWVNALDYSLEYFLDPENNDFSDSRQQKL